MEKKTIFKMIGWGLAGLVFLAVVNIGLGVINKMGERAILVNSHQYKESMLDRATTWEAELAQIDARLSGQLLEGVRANLVSQKAALIIQLQSARR